MVAMIGTTSRRATLHLWFATLLLVTAACAGDDDPGDTADESAPTTTVAVLDPPSHTDADSGTAASDDDEIDGWFEAADELDPDEPVDFAVVGTDAVMVGFIDGSTPDRVADLLDDHPEVDRIVLVDVPGSDNDVANVEAALAVHEAGLATHVPAEGRIASGGVDFFLAGVTRTYTSGASFEVHSWSTGEDGFTALDLDDDDPEHRRYLDYYDAVGVDPDFYWFTLEAARPEDLHEMTEAELDEFGFRR